MLTSISQILTPVALCSLYVVLLVRLLEWDTRVAPNVFDKTWYKLGIRPSTDIVSKSLIMVGVFVLLIALVSMIVLFAFYMRCYGCLKQYFRLPSLIIMALITPTILRGILTSLNCFSLDIFTLLLFTWNFTALGCMSIFGIYASAPLVLQQLYLIHNSAMLALLMITALPGWAPWILLTILVFWDLFAVLAPYGPLNLILSIADREGITDMPGLIYSTSANQDKLGKSCRQHDRNSSDSVPTPITKKDPAEQVTVRTPLDISETRVDTVDSTLEELQPINPIENISLKTSDITVTTLRHDTVGTIMNERPPKDIGRTNANLKQQPELESPQPSPAEKTSRAATSVKESSLSPSLLSLSSQDELFEDRGVSMGLGDFIFYGLLVGLTCRGRDTYDYYATVAVLESIFMGVVATLIILVVRKQAIPALPISLSLGLLVAPLAMQFAPKLSNLLASNQVFI